MHPYRDLPTTSPEGLESSNEELIVYGLLVAIGVIPVVIALVQHARFGFWETIGLIMACAGTVGFLACGLRWWRR